VFGPLTVYSGGQEMTPSTQNSVLELQRPTEITSGQRSLYCTSYIYTHVGSESAILMFHFTYNLRFHHISYLHFPVFFISVPFFVFLLIPSSVFIRLSLLLIVLFCSLSYFPGFVLPYYVCILHTTVGTTARVPVVITCDIITFLQH
jgi:hypothetical protein